jgi:hypothetical protein
MRGNGLQAAAAAVVEIRREGSGDLETALDALALAVQEERERGARRVARMRAGR